jgi:hypothetical protein
MPSMASKVIAILFVGIILFAGPGLLILDAALAVRNFLFIRTSVATGGTVLELRTVRGTRNGHSYAPVFRFVAEDGETYIHVSNMSSNPAGFTIGQQVRVLYQHGHPENAKIDTFFQLWLPEFVLTIVGVGFSVIPAIVIRRKLIQRA